MKNKLKLIIFISLITLIFISTFSIIFKSKDQSNNYDSIKDNYSDEELSYIQYYNFDIKDILEYQKYSNFNIFNLRSYLELKNSYKLGVLESINYYNNPNYYNFYNNPSPAKFPDTEIILVNKCHFLEEDYIPIDLVHIDNYDIPHNNWIFLKRIVLEQLEEMINESRKESLNLLVFSGYRSYKLQSELYEKNNRDDSYSARAGHSEHQTGYAFDISTQASSLTLKFKDSLEYSWLINNAYKFGFILRYPENKENLTGFSYEPWHFRYVGAHAEFIWRNNLSLEEYILSYLEI